MHRDKTLSKLTKRVVCIDIHSHSGGIDMYNYQHKRLPITQNMRDLSLKMKLSNIDYFAVFPLPSTTYFNSKSFSVTGIDEFPYQLSNDALLYESQLFADNALPFLAIHPTEKVDKQLVYLEKNNSSGKIFGLKFHSLATHTTIDDLINSDFPKFLHTYRLPIMIHSDDFSKYSDPKTVFKFVEKYSDLKVCIAHCGFFDQAFYRRINEYTNLFIDSSSFSVLCQLFLKRSCNKGKLDLDWRNPNKSLLELYNLTINKLMWGTDEPWTYYTDYDSTLVVKGNIFIEKAVLDSLPPEIKDKISYHNTLEFLKG